VWTLFGLGLVLAVFPWLALPGRDWISRWWSRGMLCLCGVKVKVNGKPCLHGPALLVANHVSWVDVFVINSVRATAFIAKSEIRSWPLLGALVSRSGTLFIERGQRHAVRSVGHQMQRCFRDGRLLGLFPEGTTSTGFDVGPFHSSLFDPAIRAGVPILPAALRFYHHGKRSDAAAFVGDQSMLDNLWFLLRARGVVVRLDFLPMVDAAECLAQGRASVAANAHHAIRRVVIGPDA
jgi:1-acyl-sn-glycerol-3-phosphate acyltransferase